VRRKGATVAMSAGWLAAGKIDVVGVPLELKIGEADRRALQPVRGGRAQGFATSARATGSLLSARGPGAVLGASGVEWIDVRPGDISAAYQNAWQDASGKMVRSNLYGIGLWCIDPFSMVWK
jgi:hypothetical protein